MFILFAFQSCVNKKSRDNFLFSEQFERNPKIFLEKYQIYTGGVFAGSSYSYYLTDSINYRILAGYIYFDDERLVFEDNLNEILVHRLKKTNDISTFQEDTIETHKYSIYEDRLKLQ